MEFIKRELRAWKNYVHTGIYLARLHSALALCKLGKALIKLSKKVSPHG